MIIERDFKWYTHKAMLLVLPILLLFGVVMLIVLYWKPKPVGGEIFPPDLEDGVKIYVEEGYSLINTDGAYTAPTESPHSIWLVSDENLNKEILKHCGEIKKYRQIEPVRDTMLGSADVYRAFPRIFLVADAFCYKIEILNWENFSGDAWSGFPIRRERFGKPTLRIFRIDLSSMPEGETPYDFAREYCGADSVNSEGGHGWYSMVSQQTMDELLSLLGGINTENAEEVELLGDASKKGKDVDTQASFD